MTDDELDLRFELVLRSKDAEYGLGDLMHTLKAEGMPQDEMYALFDRHRAKHQNDADETDRDHISDLMDLIVGWCSPEVQLYDPLPPPQKLGGADVLLWTNSRKRYCTAEIGGMHHEVRAMAICGPSIRGEVVLNKCYVEWTVIESIACQSVEEAKARAERCGVVQMAWKTCN